MQNLSSIRQLGAELWTDSHTKVSFAVPLFKYCQAPGPVQCPGSGPVQGPGQGLNSELKIQCQILKRKDLE